MEVLRRWRSSLRSFALDLVRLQHPLSILYLMAINSFFCFVAFYTSREVQLRTLYALSSFVIFVAFALAEHRRNLLVELIRWAFNDFFNSFAVALCAFSVNELHEGRERRAFFGSLFAVCAIVVAPAYAHRRINSEIAKFASRLSNWLRQFLNDYVARPIFVLWDWLKYIVLLRWLSVLVFRLNVSLLSAWDWLDLRLFDPLRALRHQLGRFFVYVFHLHWCADLWALIRRMAIDPTLVRLSRLLDGFIYVFGCYWLKPALRRMGRACLDLIKFGFCMFGRASYASTALLYEHVLCPIIIFCIDRLEQLSIRLFQMAIRPLLTICYQKYKMVEDLALVYIIGPVLKRFLDLVPERNPLEPESDHELDSFIPDFDGSDDEGALNEEETSRSMDREAADSAMDSEGFGDELDDLSSKLSFDGDRLLASGLKRIDISGSDSEVDDFLPISNKKSAAGGRRAI
uniref:Ion_trans domain-containing protein n=1 Tax=Globodera pallida TaxID=36090 RepID=A0A183C7J6_GLOPA